MRQRSQVLFLRPLWSSLTVIVLTILMSGAALASESPTTDWPNFRGPWKNGNAQPPGSKEMRGLPLTWSETENIAWKTALPNEGHSSPVIMDGRLWLTAATPDGRESYVMCVDIETGEILLNKRLFQTEHPEPLGNNINGYASPSPVLEPGRVYVHFGSYGTACLDTLTHEVLWARRDLPCRHYRGPGLSPLLYENLLILSFDGVDQQYVTALDKKTGETVWRTDRSTVWEDLDEDGLPRNEGDYRKAFCTPIVIEWAGRKQLISLGAKAGFAYDPYTGAELWKTSHAGHSSSPRPLFGNGFVYVTTGHSQTELWAIRPDGEGDVTETHVAWRVTDRIVPEQPSPVLVDDLIYMVSNGGIASCIDALTGEVLWRERIGGNYMASPIHADGRIYVSSMQGTSTVMRAGRAFELLASNRLESGCLASPAVSGKALFLRTKTHLYRIESKE